MLFFAISFFVMSYLYVEEIILNPRIAYVMILIWMMAIGNYHVNIEPNQETVSVYFDDEEINKKSKRFLGKIQVFGALITIILVLILPENINYYSIGIYLISLLLLPYLYARKLHKKKFA
jgi:peptidoglycan/LPS O-acetylase OafA/YrhL